MEEKTVARHTSAENHAIRRVASTLGALVGLAGINHGLFEILQGNVSTDGLMIAAIGPEQRFWVYGEETALTIIPIFLLSGILAVVLGVVVMVWALAYVHTRRGALILMLLSTMLFLVGGGFAPIFMAILASISAGQIHRPLSLWRRLLPSRILRMIGSLWLPSLVLFVAVFVFSVEVAITGWPLTVFFDPEAAFAHLNTLGLIMVPLMLLCMLFALAHDTECRLAGNRSL
jgi:hypothetical protein